MAVTIVSVITELMTWEEPNPQISTVVAAVGSGLSKEATPGDFSNLLPRIEPIVFKQCVCKICSFIFFLLCCVYSYCTSHPFSLGSATKKGTSLNVREERSD